MSKNAKIALIVTLVVLGLFGTCVGGAVWWWNTNGQDFIETAKTSMKEGANFGETATDQAECIDRGIEMSAECGQMGIACGTRAQMFAQGCLYTAPETPGICDGVPGPTDVIDAVGWSTGECKDRGQTLNNFCASVLGSLQAYCEHPDAELNLEKLEDPPASP
jgi:hypothetical protein